VPGHLRARRLVVALVADGAEVTLVEHRERQRLRLRRGIELDGNADETEADHAFPDCPRHRHLLGDAIFAPTRANISSVSGCRTRGMRAHGSRLREPTIPGTFFTLKRSKRTSSASSGQPIGIETGAPRLARAEYAATAVAP